MEDNYALMMNQRPNNNLRSKNSFKKNRYKRSLNSYKSVSNLTPRSPSKLPAISPKVYKSIEPAEKTEITPSNIQRIKIFDSLVYPSQRGGGNETIDTINRFLGNKNTHRSVDRKLQRQRKTKQKQPKSKSLANRHRRQIVSIDHKNLDMEDQTGDEEYQEEPQVYMQPKITDKLVPSNKRRQIQRASDNAIIALKAKNRA